MADCVYFALTRADRDYLKIGRTQTDPRKRIAGVKTGNPNEVYLILVSEAPRDTEKKLHKLFEDYRHHLEWFRFEGRLRDFVNELVDDPMYDFLDSWRLDMELRLIKKAEELFECLSDDYCCFENKEADNWFSKRMKLVSGFENKICGDDFTFNQLRWMANYYDNKMQCPWVFGNRLDRKLDLWLDWAGKIKLDDDKLAETVFYERILPWDEHCEKQKQSWVT